MADPPAASIRNTIGQFLKRYRAAVMARSLVLAALALAAAGLLAWRLRLFHLSAVLSIGIPLGLWLALAAWLAVWAYRHWLSQRMAAAQLDKALGLEERLVTAEEFAGSTKLPTLYPILVQDLARQCTAEKTKVPKPVDRSAGVLLMMILLLLLWPSLNQMLPPSLRLPEIPKREKAAVSAQEQKGEKEQSGGQAQSSSAFSVSSSTAQPMQPSGSFSSEQSPASQNSPQSSPAGQPSSEGGTSSPAAGQSQGTTQAGKQPNTQSGSLAPQSASAGNASSAEKQQQSASGESTRNAQAAGGRQSSARKPTQSEANNAQRSDVGNPSSSSSQRNQASGDQQQFQKGGTNANASSGEQGKQGQQASQATVAQNYQSKAAGQSGPGQKQQGAGSQAGTGSQGTGQSSLEGEALKAEIQGLLKEVSGELKDLQAQLNAADQARPQAGTQADPNLYGSAEPMDANKGNVVPVQLKTDSAPTQKQRPAGGTGSASPEAASAAPQTIPEEASLSNAPREETPASQQHVPAEYRGILDQLQKQPVKKVKKLD